MQSVVLSVLISVGFLRCEYLVNPTGIDQAAPRLSWVVESSQRGQMQTAYRVLVASSEANLQADQGDLWDSGKVASDDTTAVVYAGKPLASGTRYFWKVMVWGKNDKPSDWSPTATWLTGLMQPSEWKAQWIGYDKSRNVEPIKWTDGRGKSWSQRLPPASYLRAAFRAEKPIRSAVLYVTALGLCDVYLNGKPVTDDYFNPGWTDYAKRVYYRQYDVTQAIQQGDNAIGAALSDGWYSGYIGWNGDRDHYGKKPRFASQLCIEYTDGTRDTVATGPDWKATVGPIRQADLLMGETYDARLELPKWSEAGCDDAKWDAVEVGSEVNPLVQSHPGVPVKSYTQFKAKSIRETKPGTYIVDLGQNFAGIVRLTVNGAKAGQAVQLRFAERLNPDGSFYTANLRSARATDTYTCKGLGKEVWQPRFTFHGFQYVEVSGLPTPPTEETIVGVALSSDTPVVGQFDCPDPMLQRLYKNIYYTQRSNFIDIPTDCPQRDERLGWTGDAQIYIRTATLNTDVQAFFRKWLIDLDDAQRADGQYPSVAPLKIVGDDGGPAWSDVGVVCPWTIYEVYGDRRLLAEHYDAMTRFIAFCKNRSTPELLPPKKFQSCGDWLQINADTPLDVIYLAYFAYSTRLTARAAEALGKTEDAAKYNDLFAKIKAAFNREYVGADGRIKGDTQTCYVLAIAFELLDKEKQKQAANHLVENIKQHGWHLSTGFVGTKDLMLALAKADRNDVAYRLLHNDTFPSWGFSIKHGATSIWERWDGWTPDKGFQDVGMNSFAHYSFGAVYQWMFENIGGIRNDGPTYKKIVIKPQPEAKLGWAKVGYKSIRGQIQSDWKLADGKLLLDVAIPANTTAMVYIPTAENGTPSSKVTESGRPLDKAEGVKFLRAEGGCVVVAIESGSYHFAAPAEKTPGSD